MDELKLFLRTCRRIAMLRRAMRNQPSDVSDAAVRSVASAWSDTRRWPLFLRYLMIQVVMVAALNHAKEAAYSAAWAKKHEGGNQ